jgi:hypothetical protein
MTNPRSDKIYPTGEPLSKAYKETFIGGRSEQIPDNHIEEEDWWELIGGGWRGPTGILDRLIICTTYCIARAVFQTLRDTVLRVSRPDRDFALYLSAFGRCMFLSRDAYIGLGPKNMQPGDSLALLVGGKMPYVLRRKGECYELVGECYMHGVMRGERFDANQCQQIWLA